MSLRWKSFPHLESFILLVLIQSELNLPVSLLETQLGIYFSEWTSVMMHLLRKSVQNTLMTETEKNLYPRGSNPQPHALLLRNICRPVVKPTQKIQHFRPLSNRCQGTSDFVLIRAIPPRLSLFTISYNHLTNYGQMDISEYSYIGFNSEVHLTQPSVLYTNAWRFAGFFSTDRSQKVKFFTVQHNLAAVIYFHSAINLDVDQDKIRQLRILQRLFFPLISNSFVSSRICVEGSQLTLLGLTCRWILCEIMSQP